MAVTPPLPELNDYDISQHTQVPLSGFHSNKESNKLQWIDLLPESPTQHNYLSLLKKDSLGGFH